ncbi:hypothetical protein ACFLT8_06240, partial [Chloroflexota bacterium]
GPPPPEKPTMKKQEIGPYDYTLEYAWRMVKSHRMGRNDGVGGFTIEEYEDRYEFVWDPCYSGGRTRRGDPITGTPPRMGPPYYYSGNQVPHPWTWGKTGVSGFCIHCGFAHNIMDVERTGYLRWVTGYPDDPWKPCTYIAYKDVDWIPEECYTRIGKTKPKPTSPVPKFKDVTKPIKVIHSDELGPEWVHTLNLLKRAIDAGKKEEALKRLDELLLPMGQLKPPAGVVSPPPRGRGRGPAPLDLIVEKYGYNELYHALRWIYSPYNPPPAPDEPRPTKATIPSAEKRARKGALWGRSVRSGPNAEGSVRIIEEPDRIVMELDPCGTIAPSLRMEMPPNVTTVAHPVAWGKVGIPLSCARCCVHIEAAAVARSGYLTEIVERPENATDPNCRWFFYKELDDIPEKYYTRIGAKKPARKR